MATTATEIRVDRVDAATRAMPRTTSASDADHFRSRMLAVADAVIVIASVAIAHIVAFGRDRVELSVHLHRVVDVPYLVVSVLIAAAWLVLLVVMRTRNPRFRGTDTDEYKSLLGVSFILFGGIAIVSYLSKVQLARGYLLLALGLGTGGLLVGRRIARAQLTRARARGKYCSSAVVVGRFQSAEAIARRLARHPEVGLRIIGVCTDAGDEAIQSTTSGVPVVGNTDNVIGVMRSLGANTLIVGGSRSITSKQVREYSWALESGSEHLILAPSLMDIAGPRLHTRTVGSLPLIQVETPRLSTWGSVVKRLLDIIVAVIGIIVTSPIMLGAVIAIKLDDGGPVLFRHERIGKEGKPFKILKFRSMRVGADKELKKLLAEQGLDEKPLFKLTEDPRITRVGAVLRKTSIDELPQFFNVLNGTMSVVGPRPQVAAEVALYDATATRRLTVAPGITGLWQVSGRSDLEWEDALRLDLYYVENWSLAQDLQILFRTVRVVLQGEGAY